MKKVFTAIMAGLLMVMLSVPVMAGNNGDNGNHYGQNKNSCEGKCNAGRGNGSETTPATDCDPGNSGANNQGGD